MAVNIAVLWKAPEVNPITKKARSIPALNPVDRYGRVFTFSWWGFLIAFLSWYAFPPLMTRTIRQDLNLTQADVANSNIAALTATLLVRLISGTLCDRFGPRLVFAGCLFAGAIPTALAGAVTNASGLIALRFFVGILGASFVPCQVWSTGFFDKNIVGSANALVGGFGNAGGGITYFVMPAIFDSLVRDQGLTPHVAWRVSFIVPFILITATGIAMLLLCPDTPTGKWSERHLDFAQNQNTQPSNDVVDLKGEIHASTSPDHRPSDLSESSSDKKDQEKTHDPEKTIDESEVIAGYQHETIVAPTPKEIAKVFMSPQSIVLAACYFCSFGAELAINSILGSYYLKNFPTLGQTNSGKWAAMFGLLNVFFRPAGGFISDLLYKYTHGSLWAKKMWIHFLAFSTGAFAIAIGLSNPHNLSTMIGLVAGMAFFMDAGNGANFSLVPHVHPYANGLISGFTGATGNFGGIIFAIIFRYNHSDYARVLWIIGVMTIAINLAVCWIKPLPKGQIGGR